MTDKKCTLIRNKMDEQKLRDLFRNMSDCYADTGRFENDGSYSEGEVIQAMTEDRFIEIIKVTFI